MCLEILYPEGCTSCPPPIIAKKAVVCYKTGYRLSKNTFSPKVMRFIYKKGKITEKVSLRPYDYRFYCTIEEGYHSFIKYSSGDSTELFIIPKGSRYYKGGVNQFTDVDGYVSDRIIWVGSKYSLITWFKVLLYKLNIK